VEFTFPLPPRLEALVILLARRSTRPLLLATVSWILLSTAASAQGETGFLRGKGRADVVLGATLDRYDHFYVGDMRVENPAVGTVKRWSGVLYAAYGLRDDLDLIASAAWVRSQSNGTANSPTEEDLQDFLLAAKWRFAQWRLGRGAFSLLAEPGIKVPITDYENDAITAIGDGQIDLRGRVILHYVLDSGAFASLETGYDRRNGEPHDEVPINLTVGGNVGPVTIAPFYSRIDSLGGTNIGDPGFDFPGLEEDLERVGVSLYWRVNDHFGVTGSWRTTIGGKNTGDVDGYSFGVVARL